MTATQISVEPIETERSKTVGQVDPALIELAMQGFISEQNFTNGVMAGLVAALVGAVTWAAITVGAGYQIGWMAVGVAFLVGVTMRAAGKGFGVHFGMAGALIALFGCMLGNIFSMSYYIAEAQGVSTLAIVSGLNPTMGVELLTVGFMPIDLLFYGIALYEGYRLSRRQVSEEELMDAVAEIDETGHLHTPGDSATA